MQAWTPAALDDIAGIVDRWEYDYYGLRVMSVYNQDVPAPTVGQTLEPSSVWVDGTPTDDVLDGTCALGIHLDYRDDDEAGMICQRAALRRLAQQAGSYWGRYVVLIAGNFSSGGEDLGEVIIQDAVALAVYDRGSACCDRKQWTEVAA